MQSRNASVCRANFVEHSGRMLLVRQWLLSSDNEPVWNNSHLSPWCHAQPTMVSLQIRPHSSLTKTLLVLLRSTSPINRASSTWPNVHAVRTWTMCHLVHPPVFTPKGKRNQGSRFSRTSRPFYRWDLYLEENCCKAITCVCVCGCVCQVLQLRRGAGTAPRSQVVLKEPCRRVSGGAIEIVFFRCISTCTVAPIGLDLKQRDFTHDSSLERILKKFIRWWGYNHAYSIFSEICHMFSGNSILSMHLAVSCIRVRPAAVSCQNLIEQDRRVLEFHHIILAL